MLENPAITKNFIFERLEEAIAVKKDFFERQSEDLIKVAEWMGTALQNNHKILICGNGGSASDAQHFAGEMIGRFLKERNALPAIALCTDTSVLTAVGNDYGYEHIFSRQIDALAQKGDLLFAISTSGNSPNILRAVESARKKDMKIVGLTGGSGGKLVSVCDLTLNANLGKNSPRIQETHIMIIHLLVDLLDTFFLKKQ